MLALTEGLLGSAPITLRAKNGLGVTECDVAFQSPLPQVPQIQLRIPVTQDPPGDPGRNRIPAGRIALCPGELAASETPEEIVAQHPRLTIESIRAAIAFAAEALRADVIYPFERVVS